ncbi:cellulose biosynthesis cyclic di-GMP-binding regulatory protein BcsB [Microbaculum marinum]|uniref:Cyclic di-GMP-binding protein n=1 Tax=Microbaculum marinum TaxID=1764581 RepID=A0AAW9RD72_9HYPH
MTVPARWLIGVRLATAAGLVLMALSAQAQQTERPFQMEPRTGDTVDERPEAPAESQPAAPGVSRPFSMDPSGNAPEPVNRAGQAPVRTMPAQGTALVDRPVLPAETFMFTGEIDSYAWTVFLTSKQAEGPARFSVRFTNSVVVVPEESWLRVTMNDQIVLETRIDASDSARTVQVDVAAGVLAPGDNKVRFQVRQSHRVDCTEQATYELWTRVFSEGTGFRFSNPQSAQITSLAELPAIGVGENGRTTIHLIQGGNPSPGVMEAALQAIQEVVLIGQFAHPVVRFADDLPADAGFGEFALIVATADTVASRLGLRPDDADQQGIFRVIPADIAGITTVVISGPTPESIRNTLERSAQQLQQAYPPTDVIETSSWWSPNVAVLSGSRGISLADLGVSSIEFAGRRFQTRFMVGLAPDFYAAAYGEATLFLDAAFASDALPESRVDVYVNNQIASTLQIRTRGGTLFSRQPINIPLKNFTPGLNEIRLEAIVKTSADAACLPGATTPTQPRFALFDSSELRFPEYARIARRPDLAPFAAGAYPYAEEGVTTILISDTDPQSLSAAGTLSARLATLRSRLIPLQVAATDAELANAAALIVGPVASLPPGILPQVGVSTNVRQTWQPSPSPGSEGSGPDITTLPRGEGAPDGPMTMRTPPGATDNLQAEWRERVTTSTWRNALVRLENWLQETFDITISSFPVELGESAMMTPPAGADLLIAQGPSFDRQHVWTLLTAPDAEDLANVTAQLTAPTLWRQISGRAATFDTASQSLSTTPVSTFEFVVTSPLTPRNVRLIAANWLSENIATYALLIAFSCVLLGISTAMLLRRIGRTE